MIHLIKEKEYELVKKLHNKTFLENILDYKIYSKKYNLETFVYYENWWSRLSCRIRFRSDCLP